MKRITNQIGGITSPLLIAALPSLIAALPLAAVAQEDSEDTGSGFMIEEIIVTATKRAQRLDDVPVSTVFISAERLEMSGFEQVIDMQYSTPGFVQTGAENAGWIQLTMRGITTVTVTTGFSLGVGMFVDGVDQGTPYSFNNELVDVQQIEVLRGPQGTLFGKNTIAGAFNVTTIKPDLNETRGLVKINGGNFDLINVEGSVSVPIVEGKFATKLSVYRKKRDGFAKNVFTGGSVNDRNQVGGRMQFRFTPSSDFTLDIGIDYLRERRNFAYHEIIADTPGGVDYTGQIPEGLYTISHDFDDTENRDLWGVHINADYELANGYTLTSISGYRGGRDDILEDTDHTSRSDQIYHQFKNFDQITQEIRLASPEALASGSKYDFVVGTYVLKQEANQTLAFEFGPESGLTPETSYAPANFQSLQLALFGQGNWYFTRALSVNVGTRVNYERKQMDFSEDGYSEAFFFPETPFFRDDFTETSFEPTFSLNYKFSDDILTYAKFTRGFKSGAFDLGIFKGGGGPGDFRFGSEKVNAFEVGVKGSLADRRMTFGLAGYYMDYTDLQIEVIIPSGDPNLPGTRSRGAAAANIYGVEFETVVRPVEPLTLDGGFAWSSAKFKDGVPGLGGNHLANAPEWTGYANATFEVPVGNTASVYVRGEWTFRGKWYSFGTNRSFEAPPSFNLFNARAGFQSDMGWELAVWAKNLANTEYCTELWDIIGGLRCGIGRPRTYGLSASYRY